MLACGANADSDPGRDQLSVQARRHDTQGSEAGPGGGNSHPHNPER